VLELAFFLPTGAAIKCLIVAPLKASGGCQSIVTGYRCEGTSD